MDGKTPKRIISFSLTETKFIVSLLTGVLVLVATVWAAASGAIRAMESRAGDNFDKRIQVELHPPEGEIYTAIVAEMHVHEARRKVEILEATQDNELRLQRVEWMVEQVYTATTGQEPPAQPVGR